MKPVSHYSFYCQHCMAHFTDSNKTTAQASRNAHEEVCGDNPDNQDSTNRGKNEQT